MRRADIKAGVVKEGGRMPATEKPDEERLAYKIGFVLGPVIGIGLTIAFLIFMTWWLAYLYTHSSH